MSSGHSAVWSISAARGATRSSASSRTASRRSSLLLGQARTGPAAGGLAVTGAHASSGVAPIGGTLRTARMSGVTSAIGEV